jgi:hypothetical protein
MWPMKSLPLDDPGRVTSLTGRDGKNNTGQFPMGGSLRTRPIRLSAPVADSGGKKRSLANGETFQDPPPSSDDTGSVIPRRPRERPGVRPEHPVPEPGPAPTPASRRLAPILAIWSLSLVVLVLGELRDLPPILVGLLLPYLALVAWHLLSGSGRRPAKSSPTPARSVGGTDSRPEPRVLGSPPSCSPDERTESCDSCGPEPAPGDPPGPQPLHPPRFRGRRRGKPIPPPAPAPASWVQIAPGRFVRGEIPEPTLEVPGEDATEAGTAGKGPAKEAELKEPCEPGSVDTPVGSPEEVTVTAAAFDHDAGDRNDEPIAVPRCVDAPVEEPEIGGIVSW